MPEDRDLKDENNHKELDAIVNLDMKDTIDSWAASPEVTEAGLVDAMARCGEARAGLLRNANAVLTIEATLVELGRLVPPPEAAPAPW